MPKKPRDPWLRLGQSVFMLGGESASVIALRSMKIAAGGAAAEREARRMVEEKIAAAQALQLLALTGGLGFGLPTVAQSSLNNYRRKVRANRRRLSRG